MRGTKNPDETTTWEGVDVRLRPSESDHAAVYVRVDNDTMARAQPGFTYMLGGLLAKDIDIRVI